MKYLFSLSLHRKSNTYVYVLRIQVIYGLNWRLHRKLVENLNIDKIEMSHIISAGVENTGSSQIDYTFQAIGYDSEVHSIANKHL